MRMVFNKDSFYELGKPRLVLDRVLRTRIKLQSEPDKSLEKLFKLFLKVILLQIVYQSNKVVHLVRPLLHPGLK